MKDRRRRENGPGRGRDETGLQRRNEIEAWLHQQRKKNGLDKSCRNVSERHGCEERAIINCGGEGRKKRGAQRSEFITTGKRKVRVKEQ